jgi:electron transfer flavoprotein beta subunit
MKVLVCVSHVPDTETKVKVGGDGRVIDPVGINYMLNPYDEYAIEEGLKLREKFTGEVIALSLGGETKKEALRKALAMGCDKAVLLKDGADRDSYAVAEALAGFAREYQPDIVLCGKQSIDYDDAQVGIVMAEMLGMPSISVAVKLDVDIEGNVTAEREIEGGYEILESRLPVLVTAQKGINQPRYPSLKGIMEAKRKPIEERTPAPAASKVIVLQMKKPAAKNPGKIVGTDVSAVPELIRLLREEAKVI